MGFRQNDQQDLGGGSGEVYDGEMGIGEMGGDDMGCEMGSEMDGEWSDAGEGGLSAGWDEHERSSSQADGGQAMRWAGGGDTVLWDCRDRVGSYSYRGLLEKAGRDTFPQLKQQSRYLLEKQRPPSGKQAWWQRQAAYNLSAQVRVATPRSISSPSSRPISSQRPHRPPVPVVHSRSSSRRPADPSVRLQAAADVTIHRAWRQTCQAPKTQREKRSPRTLRLARINPTIKPDAAKSECSRAQRALIGVELLLGCSFAPPTPPPLPCPFSSHLLFSLHIGFVLSTRGGGDTTGA